MIASSLLPRPWRRALIDFVYGAEDTRGLKIYLASLWGALALLALILTGTTPWAWPAVREGRVDSLQPVTCDAILGEQEAGDQRARSAETNRSSTKGSTKAGPSRSRSQCRQLLSDAERAQLGRTEATVAYLRQGGATPPALAIPTETPLRDWIDTNVCGLSGASGEDRGALAWHVEQGIGECGAWSKTVARLPLAIWWGPVLGIILTPIILFGLLFLLIRHSLRLPSTRRAYRRLYGSEHKAP
jgi:hypothetical protein